MSNAPYDRTISVNFAFSDQPKIIVTVGPEQTIADAIAPYVPEGTGQVRVLDFAGNEVTNLRGAQVQNDLSVMVSHMGQVRGG